MNAEPGVGSQEQDAGGSVESNPCSLVFMGTPALAATLLDALLGEKQFRVLAAVTQPDQRKGREMKLQPPAVKELALKKDLPVLQPERARPMPVHRLSSTKPSSPACARSSAWRWTP